MHEISRKLELTVLPIQGIFNLPHHICMVWEELAFDDAVKLYKARKWISAQLNAVMWFIPLSPGSLTQCFNQLSYLPTHAWNGIACHVYIQWNAIRYHCISTSYSIVYQAIFNCTTLYTMFSIFNEVVLCSLPCEIPYFTLHTNFLYDIYWKWTSALNAQLRKRY